MKIPQGFTTTAYSMVIGMPNAAKHFWERTGVNKESVPQELVLQEVAALFRDKLALREGDEMPVNFMPNSEAYLEFNSQTTSIVGGIEVYSHREIGANLSKSGIARVVHYLEHRDIAQYERKKAEHEAYPFKVVVRLEEPGDSES
ncbi:MAG: hypothetical protein NDJ89_18690 [Oligoflexia bacterium]|nr:hypothetical protein [Oligoflexia bacterium]